VSILIRNDQVRPGISLPNFADINLAARPLTLRGHSIPASCLPVSRRGEWSSIGSSRTKWFGSVTRVNPGGMQGSWCGSLPIFSTGCAIEQMSRPKLWN